MAKLNITYRNFCKCTTKNEFSQILWYVFKLCKLITLHILASVFNSSHIDFHFNYYVNHYVTYTCLMAINVPQKFTIFKNLGYAIR